MLAEGRKNRTEDLAGRVFGSWTVLRFSGYSKANANWWCRCACGVEKEVRAQYLKNGTSRKCVACASKAAIWTDAITPAKWHVMKSNATKRGIAFDVSNDEAYQLFIHQERRCALTGVPIELPLTNAGKGTASLDRIDSSIGYVHGNIQWVHREINMMKGSLSQDIFINWCREVTAYKE